MRADALFDFTYNQSSGHQRVQVKASHLFGKSNQLDIEHNRFYDNGYAISAFNCLRQHVRRGSSANANSATAFAPVSACCDENTNNRNVPGWL